MISTFIATLSLIASFNSLAVIYQVKVTSGMSPAFNLYGCALIGIHLPTHLFFSIFASLCTFSSIAHKAFSFHHGFYLSTKTQIGHGMEEFKHRCTSGVLYVF